MTTVLRAQPLGPFGSNRHVYPARRDVTVPHFSALKKRELQHHEFTSTQDQLEFCAQMQLHLLDFLSFPGIRNLLMKGPDPELRNQPPAQKKTTWRPRLQNLAKVVAEKVTDVAPSNKRRARSEYGGEIKKVCREEQGVVLSEDDSNTTHVSKGELRSPVPVVPDLGNTEMSFANDEGCLASNMDVLDMDSMPEEATAPIGSPKERHALFSDIGGWICGPVYRASVDEFNALFDAEISEEQAAMAMSGDTSVFEDEILLGGDLHPEVLYGMEMGFPGFH